MKVFYSCVFSLILTVGCTSWKNAKKAEIKRVEELPLTQNSSKQNDPLQVKTYELDNGLKLFVSPNKETPRVQALVLVKAGSIHDPDDATGLAHYLEHMLFKGNSNIGTVNYSAEKPLLDAIEQQYDLLKSSKDSTARRRIYASIDSLSGLAAQYAIPNEMSQMFSMIGAKGTNAYTSTEYTGYINNIPSNQVENWLRLEQQRFTQPVLRLFHTELEAVYEEKNITLDKADRQMMEIFNDALFPVHNYGQHTTIGTIEHLKSPSMTAIKKFFEQHYVPNNMGIFLAGDLDPDSSFALVKKYFGSFKTKPVKPYVFKRHQHDKVVEKHMSSKEAEHLMIGFKFDGAGSKASDIVTMVDMLLNNRTAGLFDININQAQKALSAYSYPYILRDYSRHVMGGTPLPGQKLSELKDLIFSQIELLKKGMFDEWLLDAVINDLKKSDLKSYRSNKNRVSIMSSAFAKGLSWEQQLQYYDRLSAITKEEIVAFVNKNYKENYVVLYRHQDENVKSKRVEKPQITPISTVENQSSLFLNEFAEHANVEPIEPLFVNYEQELKKAKTGNGISVFYKENTTDELFSLSLVIPFGTKANKELATAFELASLSGTSTKTAEELSKEWYKLGVDFKIVAGEEESNIYLGGVASSFPKAIELMKDILQDVQLDSLQLEALKSAAIKSRENSLKNKRHLLFTGLRNHVLYGANSPHMYALSNEQIQNLSVSSLQSLFQEASKAIDQAYYYGPQSAQGINDELAKLTIEKSAHENKKFERLAAADSNEILFLDFNMKQAEILFVNPVKAFNLKEFATASLFNEYFGGSMSSIVFQEIREKKALAYSVYAAYTMPEKKTDKHYNLAYIGTQADKFKESVDAMLSILNELPYDSLKFEQAKSAMKQKYSTDRIPPHAMLSAMKRDSKLGLKIDKRKYIYDELDQIQFKDVKRFFAENIKGKKYRIAILGSKEVIDLKQLTAFGKVTEVSVKQLFPY